MSRADVLEANLRALFDAGPRPRPARNPEDPVAPGSGLDGYRFLELLETMYTVRQLDLEARALKDSDEGYYTIASAGHEVNAAVAAALRPSDPAFLHYRSGGFFVQRARQVPGQTPIFDVLLSLTAAADEPIAGGRHKVFGSVPLFIYPQTSTIASHLPKAVGHAVAIGRAEHLEWPLPFPEDAIVVCSLGDASMNHSTAVGALNAALWASYQHIPVPILFVCEDNGLGISVNTPPGWIEKRWGSQPGMTYVPADGLDLIDTFDAATRAVQRCRRRRTPVLLHLDLVRLLGHAGTDVELAYRDIEEIKAEEALDPLLANTRRAIDSGLADGAQLGALYDEIGARVRRAAREAALRPHLESAAAVMKPLAPYTPDAVRAEAERATGYGLERELYFGGPDRLPENQPPRLLAQSINHALCDLLAKYPEMLVFGEDVAKRGGVYGITAQLYEKFGAGRVFNTLLDEQSILGMAIGAAQLGFLPVPEIQYLAYYHNAEDQIRGEASSLQYFSRGQLRNPMVVRVAGWAYQRGFGGHFHNDNSIAALRDVPGVVIATPARGEDAVGMLRTLLALAKVDGRVAFFVEPIALYRTRDLYEDGDERWLDAFPAPGAAVELGCARVYDEHDGGNPDVALVSWANGLWRSLRAARTLREEHGVRARVVDLRWLQPLDIDTLCAAAHAAGRVLVVDEGRRTGGTSEAIITALVEEYPRRHDGALPRMARYCGEDTFIPLGPAWGHVLPNEQGIVERVLRLEGSADTPGARQ
ncbi:MAG: transketolase C-terminal domain-containing protein [Acidobacteriota bacterium]|jgi:2-oxoisovalerate dehydrogenase E1 component